MPDQVPVDEHTVFVASAHWGHRAELELRILLCQGFLTCEVDVLRLQYAFCRAQVEALGRGQNHTYEPLRRLQHERLCHFVCVDPESLGLGGCRLGSPVLDDLVGDLLPVETL